MSFSRKSSLLQFPYEVLINIALETACIDSLGPPKYLLPLLLLCRPLYNALTRTPDLLGHIFRAKFDVTAARRRLGPIATLSKNLGAQLKSYCISLKRIRAGDIKANELTLEFDLWNAYLMMLENDGKNAVQLIEYARLPSFVDRFVRARLYENVAHGGWPTESTTKNLAVWLLWMVTDRAMLLREARQDREALIHLLLPFVIGCFRYNCFHAADIQFELPLALAHAENQMLPVSVVTAHGPYPQYRFSNASSRLVHFNQEVTIARPHVVQAAQLLYFARRELDGWRPPMGLPRDREHAIALGQPTGATQADYLELNAHPCARLLSCGSWDWERSLTPEDRRRVFRGEEYFPTSRALSARFDADWERLTNCIAIYSTPSQPMGTYASYAFASLVGRWVGRMLLPDESSYMALIQDPALHEHFGESFPFSTVRPFMLTIREYHCIHPETPANVRQSEQGMDEGVLNAYFPAVKMDCNRDTVTLVDEEGPERRLHRYERVRPGEASSHSQETCGLCSSNDPVRRRARRMARSMVEKDLQEAGLGEEAAEVEYEATVEKGPCTGVQDIIFTGKTEERHGDAWCHYRYYGRLRPWDGLIVLVGVPFDVNETFWGKWIFRGYLHGGQNFTGRWRHYAYDLYHPPYEGAFTLSKRVEEDNAPPIACLAGSSRTLLNRPNPDLTNGRK